MSLWNGAWYIAKRDLLKDKMTFVWGMGICFVMIMTITTHGALIKLSVNEAIYPTTFAISLVISLMFQTLGFGMGRDYFSKYYRTDLFTKRISFLNTMPISINQIILARYIQHTIILISMNIIIFSVIGIWTNLFDVYGLTTANFIQLIFTWFGYSSLFGSFYILMEFGFHGRVYLVASIIVVTCYTIGCIFISIYYRLSIWHIVIDWIKAYGYIIPCVSLVAGGLVTFLMVKLLQRRMKTRDLYI